MLITVNPYYRKALLRVTLHTLYKECDIKSLPGKNR